MGIVCRRSTSKEIVGFNINPTVKKGIVSVYFGIYLLHHGSPESMICSIIVKDHSLSVSIKVEVVIDNHSCRLSSDKDLDSEDTFLVVCLGKEDLFKPLRVFSYSRQRS